MITVFNFVFTSVAFFTIHCSSISNQATASMDEVTCVSSQKLCRSDPECRRLYKSIKGHCDAHGPSCPANDAVKKKCTMDLDSIRNHSIFKQDCGCYSPTKMEMLGRKCSRVHNLIFANPCYVVDEDIYKPPIHRLHVAISIQSNARKEPPLTSSLPTVTDEVGAIIAEKGSSDPKITSVPLSIFSTTEEENDIEIADYLDNFLFPKEVDSKKTNTKGNIKEMKYSTDPVISKYSSSNLREEVNPRKENIEMLNSSIVDADLLLIRKSNTPAPILPTEKINRHDCDAVNQRKTLIIISAVLGCIATLCLVIGSVVGLKRWKHRNHKKKRSRDEPRRSVIYIKQDTLIDDLRSYEKYLRV